MKIVGWKNQMFLIIGFMLLSILMYEFPHKELIGKEHYIFYIIWPFYFLMLVFGGKIFILGNKNIRIFTIFNVFIGGRKYFLTEVDTIKISHITGKGFSTEIEIFTRLGKEDSYFTFFGISEITLIKKYFETAGIDVKSNS